MSKKERSSNKRWPWQTKQENGLPSTPTSTDRTATAQLGKPEGTLLPASLHRECRTLPLNRFIEIMVTGDLRQLIISGTPTIMDLADAWSEIIEEYVSLVKTDKADSVFELFKKIKYTEWLIAFIDKCLLGLKLQYDTDIAEWISARGYGTIQPSTDREVYLRSIYGIETGAKTLIVLLNQYTAEYKAVQTEKEELDDNQSEAEKRFRYQKEIALLGKYQGQRIRPEEITVFEYAAVINNYLQEQKIRKKEVKDGGK